MHFILGDAALSVLMRVAAIVVAVMNSATAPWDDDVQDTRVWVLNNGLVDDATPAVLHPTCQHLLTLRLAMSLASQGIRHRHVGFVVYFYIQ